jgi:hypothetical protein
MPALLLPKKGRYGLHDCEKMFCADSKSGHDIFGMRGIDRKAGCVVVVRPDQYRRAGFMPASGAERARIGPSGSGAIAVLFDVKDIPQIGPLEWGGSVASRATSPFRLP